MAKFRRRTDNNVHLKTWRAEAEKAGWKAADLDQFEFLHVAADPDGTMVLEVQGDRILYKTCFLFRSDGIGTGGIRVSRWISQTRESHWLKSVDIPDAIRSTTKPEDERGAWCPCHAYDKNPMCSICGFAGLSGCVIEITPCSCKRFETGYSARKGEVIHETGCPVVDLKAEAMLSDLFFDDEPKEEKPVEAPKPVAKLEFGVHLPKPKRKKVPKKVLDSLPLGILK